MMTTGSAVQSVLKLLVLSNGEKAWLLVDATVPDLPDGFVASRQRILRDNGISRKGPGVQTAKPSVTGVQFYRFRPRPPPPDLHDQSVPSDLHLSAEIEIALWRVCLARLSPVVRPHAQPAPPPFKYPQPAPHADFGTEFGKGTSTGLRYGRA